MSTNQPDQLEFVAFVGIDWADRQHVWALRQAGSSTIESGQMDHTPEAVDQWAVKLAQRFVGRPIAVALEQSRGPLVFMLSKYAHLVYGFRRMIQLAGLDGRGTGLAKRPYMLAIRPVDADKGGKLELIWMVRGHGSFLRLKM